MHLALVGPVHPLRGGIALHGLRLAAAAHARGHRVTIFSFRRLYPRLFFPGRSELDPGPAVASLPETAIDRRLDALRPASWLAVAASLREARPDVVVLQRWHPFFAPVLAFVARAARGAGARVVWMVHNARPHERSRLPWGPFLTLGIRSSDRVLTHARTEAEALAALRVRADVRVLPMPAPRYGDVPDRATARRELGIDSAEAVFLFLGYVRAYKGVEVFLAALPRLARGARPWRALIVGEWYLERASLDELERRAAGAGTLEVVDRYVSEPEVSRYLAASDVVVLPYRTATQSAVIPLAYAHGRGVITTRVGSLQDAVEEGRTGRVIPPDDPGALAAALEDVRQGAGFDAAALSAACERTGFASLVAALESFASPASLEIASARG